MKAILILNNRFKNFLSILFLQLVILTLFRIAFFTYFKESGVTKEMSALIKAFYIGFKFDLRLSLIILFPLFILLLVSLFTKFKSFFKFEKWYLLILQFLILILYYFDFGTFAYLKQRLNTSVSKLLNERSIALEMLWQSYPVIRITLFTIFFLCLYQFILKKILSNDTFEFQIKAVLNKILVTLLLVLLFAGGIYGKISYYPLRWVDAFFSTNNYISQLSLNPVLYYFDTKQFGKEYINYQAELKPLYADLVKVLDFKVGEVDKEKLNFVRKKEAIDSKLKQPNIVIIVLESFAAYKSSLFKNELKASPYFDKLANDGLFFPNYYVPCQATARSMFALVTGLPDLTVSNTSTRNPFLVDQHSIINEFVGYDKLYFLGGSANWGNIRGIFSHNIDNIEIIEEGSFKSPRTDVWGISDYHLMIEANDYLKQKTKPFFAIIQTAGFHRPYTIPSDSGTFKVEKVDSQATLDKNGFISEEEYNSLRFQDYSLGNFIELAKREKYFENTIFIMYGDHGLPANQAANVSAGARFHNLENFHVPFLIYAPKLIPPQVNNKPMSQMDLLPSIASLIGMPYNNTTLGRNIFDETIDKNRFLFVYYWYTLPPEFAVFNSEFYYKDNLKNISELYRYTDASFDKNIKESEPVTTQNLQNLARGYFFAAKHLMMNNKKIK